MSPYKNFLNSTRMYFNSVSFLRFLLSGYIFIFALGGLLYLLGAFILGVYEPFMILGGILMYLGLILTIIREDMMSLVITSGIIALGSLIAWIIALVGTRVYGFAVGGMFMFGPLFYFLAFGLIATLVFIKADKFRQMRAAYAARAQMNIVPCSRCGALTPMNAVFCPSCGMQNPTQPQYTPPAQPQNATPAQPEAAVPKCTSCGSDISQGAAFCAHCGAKQ